jgi:hypothetical protein
MHDNTTNKKNNLEIFKKGHERAITAFAYFHIVLNWRQNNELNQAGKLRFYVLSLLEID